MKLPVTDKTPSGQPFTLSEWSLNWMPYLEVGSIGVPLRKGIDHAALLHRLKTGVLTNEECRTYFAI